MVAARGHAADAIEQRPLGEAEAEDGAAAFDTVLRIVVSAARRPHDVRCRHCTRLGTDEAWLLQLVMVLQRARRLEAVAILAEWLPPAAARVAMMPALGFAGALAA